MLIALGTSRRKRVGVSLVSGPQGDRGVGKGSSRTASTPNQHPDAICSQLPQRRNGRNLCNAYIVGRQHRRTGRSEEHTSELQSRLHLVCRLLLEKKKENDRQTL